MKSIFLKLLLALTVGSLITVAAFASEHPMSGKWRGPGRSFEFDERTGRTSSAACSEISFEVLRTPRTVFVADLNMDCKPVGFSSPGIRFLDIDGSLLWEDGKKVGTIATDKLCYEDLAYAAGYCFSLKKEKLRVEYHDKNRALRVDGLLSKQP